MLYFEGWICLRFSRCCSIPRTSSKQLSRPKWIQGKCCFIWKWIWSCRG
jgi:hypothetical protein